MDFQILFENSFSPCQHIQLCFNILFTNSFYPVLISKIKRWMGFGLKVKESGKKEYIHQMCAKKKRISLKSKMRPLRIK